MSSPTVDTLGGTPNADPLGETYNSVTPYRCGGYIAKYRLMPIAPDQRALTGRTVEAADRPDAIREDVRAEMARLDAEWEFQVQLCRDLEKQPIKDPTVEWDEAISPDHPVDAGDGHVRKPWVRVFGAPVHRRCVLRPLPRQ